MRTLDPRRDYLDACRKKRHTVEYEYAGGATERDVRELVAFVRELRDEVTEWLGANHPELS